MNDINRRDIDSRRLTIPKEDDIGIFTYYTSITNNLGGNHFKEVCNICGSRLHKQFPEDFPEKYKICCECSITADFVYQIPKTSNERKKYLKELKEFGYIEEFRDIKKSIHRYKKYEKNFDNLFIIKRR